MLVMKSTQTDRMPLHSCATSIVMFGCWKTGPARRNGVPLMWKKIGYFCRGRFRSRFESIYDRIRHRHHENEEARVEKRLLASRLARKRKSLLPKDRKGTTASAARDDHYRSVLAPRNRTSMRMPKR
jgi:hypothetical protein